jgi:DNA-binding transcriptional MerR regulator
MRYTVHQLAKQAGVSVRTLHYYDQIGLLKPANIEENGYRIYGDLEALKLEQILFFRELEFSLDQILEIINSKNFDIKDALTDQKKFLELKKQKIEEVIEMINRKLIGGEKNMTNSITDKIDKYKEEARQRWGQTEPYMQSMERTKNWTKDDYDRVKNEFQAILEDLAKVSDKDIKDPEVQAVIKRHHQYINQFYDTSLEMFKNLGQMYVDDPRFSKTYNDIKPGLANFVHEAINYYCSQN